MPTVKHHLAGTAALVMIHTAAFAGFTTEWQAAEGAWMTAGNWSGGVPTSGTTAIVGNTGTAQITSTDEDCANLIVGQLDEGAVEVFGGSLTIGTSLVIGDGASGEFDQIAGTVRSPALAVREGTYSLAGGTLELGTCHVSEIISPAALSMFGTSTLDVSGHFEVGPGGLFSIAGGDATIGTTTSDDLLVQGELALLFTPTVTIQNLTLNGPFAGLTLTVTQFGIGTSQVAGTLTLAGRLSVTDLSAPDGRYNVVTAAAVTGAFTDLDLPTGWTSGVDGTTLWIEKDTGMPIEPASWTDVKRAF